MRKALKIGGLLVAVVVFIGACALSYVAARGIPSYDKPTVRLAPIEATPERLAQGEKIVQSMCADCHLNPATRRLSGKFLDEVPPAFGKLYSANITQDRQHGIAAWSDADILTVLRTGIGRDGRFRVGMPNFVHMSDEDARSVIAYLRSGAAEVQATAVPSHGPEPSLLTKALANTIIKPTPFPAAPVVAPDTADLVAYGRYLVAGRYKCYDCHSPDIMKINDMEPEKTEGFMTGGGEQVTKGGATIHSRNLTPDPETGIGDWNQQEFAQAVKFGMSPHGPLRYPMPKYSRMTSTETRALFAYLQSLPAVKNATEEDGPQVADR